MAQDAGQTGRVAFADVDRRLALAIGGLILALMVTVLLAGGYYFRAVMERQQDQLSTLVTSILANSVDRVSFSGKYHARLLLEEIKAAQPGIRYIALADRDGRILAHSDPARNDSRLDAPAHLAARTILNGRPSVIRDVHVGAETIREISLPYRSGYDSGIAGVIQVGLSDTEREAALRRGLLFIVLLVAALLILGASITRLISRRFSLPVKRLADDQAATLQAIPDLLFELDEDGRYLKVLAHQEELLADARDRLLGRTVAEVLPAEAAETVRAALRDATLSGDSHGRMIRLDLPGGARWFELSVARKRVSEGELHHFIMLARDVSERHQAEHEARNLNRLYRVLSNINQLLVRHPDRDRLFRSACDIAVEEGGFVLACVALPDAEGVMRPAMHAGGKREGQAPPGQFNRLLELAGADLHMGGALIVNDIGQDARLGNLHTDLAAEGWRSLAILPIRASDVLRGYFCLCAGEVGVFDETEIELLRELADDIGFALDVATLDREKELARTQLLLADSVFENSQEGIMVTDARQRILRVNKAFMELLGYDEAELLGQTPKLFKSGIHGPDFYASLWTALEQIGHWQGEVWDRRRDGQVIPALVSVSVVKDDAGQVTHYVAVFTDISRIKKSEAELEYLARHDPLTGLPNRLMLHLRLEHALDRARREKDRLALLLLDLDRFKDVNDSYGHPMGDALLRQVAETLKLRVRSADTVSRLGGDEFAILLEGIGHADDAARVAGEIVATLNEPARLPNGKEVRIGGSIGIALYPDHGDSEEGLLQHADAALYNAKAGGRGRYKYFSEELTRAARERIAMEGRLRRALTEDELRVYYQPQIDIGSGRIVGAEALVRWQDPEEGLIPPGRFISLAEETGLIDKLGEWVLRETCRQGVRWIEAGWPAITLAVNISPHQFQNGDIGATVARILAETGFPAKRLELELTESALMEQQYDAMTTLARLRAQGVRLAIDDFGTGYSSLAYLKRFPLDVLKIDKSFVDDIPRHQDDMEIAATIIAMAHTLRFKVLAEGVETQAQLDFLKAQGCDLYQGYFMSPPVPAAEFEVFLSARGPGQPGVAGARQNLPASL